MKFNIIIPCQLKFSLYICEALDVGIGGPNNNSYNRFNEARKLFPELEKYNPSNEFYCWFPASEHQSRLDILNKLLTELKNEIR